MKKIENECVNCGPPCIGDACRYRNVIRFYCDRCHEEEKLYHYEDEELCEDCLLKNFEVVEGSEEI